MRSLRDVGTWLVEGNPDEWADTIAVDSDPLKDVRVLQHVGLVMKSGVAYAMSGGVH